MAETTLKSLSSIYFSAGFSLLILLSPFYFKRKHDIATMSGLTTTLGIFGTFIGIFFGLICFDVNNITGSVPQLLGGLRTAFLTSIAGMLAGLILKECPLLYGIKIDAEQSAKDLSTVEAMIDCLSKIERNQTDLAQKSNQQLINIEKALCGDGDTTLLTQMQKLRTSFSDKQDELLKSFRDFALNMAENNSKALIEALTQVMKDFNAKINEQFGDNFRHLNESVGKMLDWQKEYGKQVEMVVGQIKTCASAIEQSSRSLTSIVSEAKSFSSVAKYLHELLTTMDAAQNRLSEHLKAFEQVANNAKDTFPIIDEQLRKLTSEFSQSVEQTISDGKNMVHLQLESTQQLNDQIMGAQKSLGQSLLSMVSDIDTHIDNMMKENAERIAKQIQALDEQLGEELNKSLRTLGSQLSSLSSKFVQDYSPLTDQLRKVVHIAGNIRG